MSVSQLYVTYFPIFLIYLYVLNTFTSMYVRLPLLAWFGLGVLFAFEIFAFWWMRTEQLSLHFYNLLFFGSIAVAVVLVICWCLIWNKFMGRPALGW